MLELFGVLFITLFIAFLLTLVVLNLDMMFKKVRVEKLETVNPAILELIELGKGFGSTIVSAPTRKEIGENIRKLFDKQRSKQRSNRKEHSPVELQALMVSARNVAERGNKELVESKVLKDCYKAWKDFDLGWDFGSNKDHSVHTRYKQKHGGTIEFIDCKWDEDRKEVNETQEKYLETVPSHKKRVALRKKRHRKK